MSFEESKEAVDPGARSLSSYSSQGILRVVNITAVI